MNRKNFFHYWGVFRMFGGHLSKNKALILAVISITLVSSSIPTNAQNQVPYEGPGFDYSFPGEHMLFLKGEEVGLYGYFRSIYPLQDWNNTVHIVSELEKVADAKLSATSSKLASNSILLYAIALKRVLENSYVITDYAKFADALEKLDTRLQKKSMKEYGNDETSRHKTNFYFEWRRLNWGENRQYRAKSLWKAISKAPSTYGLELVQTVEIEEL